MLPYSTHVCPFSLFVETISSIKTVSRHETKCITTYIDYLGTLVYICTLVDLGVRKCYRLNRPSGHKNDVVILFIYDFSPLTDIFLNNIGNLSLISQTLCKSQFGQQQFYDVSYDFSAASRESGPSKVQTEAGFEIGDREALHFITEEIVYIGR